MLVSLAILGAAIAGLMPALRTARLWPTEAPRTARLFGGELW